MMHGYLKTYLTGQATVYSAGIETHGLNPDAVKYMAADGIDISDHQSNHVDEYLNIPFDYIITVCDHANENCPYIPGIATRIHHNFTDPSKVNSSAEAREEAFIATRNAIKEFSKEFCAENFIVT
jgi:arsenate reductase